MRSFYLFLLVLFVIINENFATLSPKSPRGEKNKKSTESNQKIEKQIIKGPQDYTVEDANLIRSEPHAKDIIINHKAFYFDTDQKNFKGLTLGYVTPWNNHGYDIAKIFGNKFTHISPVWLQIKKNGKQKYEISGLHDVDKDWIFAVKNAGRETGVKVVPRILFEGWTGTDFQNLLTNNDEIQSLCKKMINVAEKHKFNGYVLELWSPVPGHVNDQVLVDVIKQICDIVNPKGLQIILVIPPQRGTNPSFAAKHFNELYDYVTAFSLMTYDYSNPSRPGPNAPIKWIEKCIVDLTNDKNKRDKILTGLNFYGNDYSPSGGGPILGHEYIEKLKKYNEKLKFEDESIENYFEYRDDDGQIHLIFYPTLYSIKKRLELFNSLGTGVSIWELGQGLDYFYDLF